jgi:hypothetical protein
MFNIDAEVMVRDIWGDWDVMMANGHALCQTFITSVSFSIHSIFEAWCKLAELQVIYEDYLRLFEIL